MILNFSCNIFYLKDLGIIPSVSSEIYTSRPNFSSTPAILNIKDLFNFFELLNFSKKKIYYVYVFPLPV